MLFVIPFTPEFSEKVPVCLRVFAKLTIFFSIRTGEKGGMEDVCCCLVFDSVHLCTCKCASRSETGFRFQGLGFRAYPQLSTCA